MDAYSDNETHSDAGVLDDETPPSQRIDQEKGSSIPGGQKRKVDRIAKSVCLIERVSPANVLQYYHVLGKAEVEDVLDRLEYVWGMPRYTLNLHTRYNICILGPRLHYLFDNKGLLFLPMLEIIQQYRQHVIHSPLPYKPDDPDAETRKFKYSMLVPPSMKSVAIFRRKDENSTSTNAEDFEIYPFPYKGFPVIESHLLPHFVIYNAGKKLAKMDQKEVVYKEFIETNAHIDQVEKMADATLRLFHRWTNRHQFPPEWLLKTPPPTRSPPSHSSRAPTEPQRQSKRSPERQGSPTKSKRAKTDGGQGGQQQQGQGQQSRDDLDGLTLLDEHSIKRLDRRSERQIYTDTRSSIDKWRKNVVAGLDAESPNEGDVEIMS